MSDPKKETCPYCGSGRSGVDSLCDDCYKVYLGTHMGARSDEPCDCSLCRGRKSTNAKSEKA
jgi:hypothetical protein